MFCCCCCDDETDETERSPLKRTGTRFRPKRLTPPKVQPGSPLPFYSPHELVYFLSLYQMRSSVAKDSEEDYVTVGSQKLLAGTPSERIMVKDYLTPMKEALKCSPETRVVDAANIMAEHRTTIMLVVDRNQPIGLITLMGILRKVVAPMKPASTRVAEVMVRDLHYVLPTASHGDAVDLLHTKKTHCLIVADRDGECLGVATSYDIARMDAEVLQCAIQSSSTYHLCEDEDLSIVDPKEVYNESFLKVNADYRLLLHQGSMGDLHELDRPLSKNSGVKVENFMRGRDRNVTCTPGTPMGQVAIAMSARNTDAVVVVTPSDDEPAGVITTEGLVLHYLRGTTTPQCPATAAMQVPVTIGSSASRNQAVSLMHRKHVHHLVVTSTTGALLGLVTSIDIARLDAFLLKRNIWRKGSLSGASVREESVPPTTPITDSGTVQIGSRVSLTLEATFLDCAIAKD